MDLLQGLVSPGGGDSVALVLCRITGLFLLAPMFTARGVPGPFRATLVVLFTLLIWPVAREAAPGPVAITPATAATEVLIGALLGFAAGLVVAAAEMAGEVIGQSSGLSGAASIDPITFAQTPSVGIFFRLVVLTTLITLDMHLVVLDGLAASYRVAPLGAPLDLGAGAMAMLSLTTRVFADGLRMAAPVMVAILVLNTALGLMSKAAPQLQILSILFPLQTGVGLIVLGASMPFVVSSITGWQGGYDAAVDRVLSALLAGT